MTTPTKEQIRELCENLCFACENDFPCDGHCYKCESGHWKKFRWQVKETIKRWNYMQEVDKQVKAIDKRVKKMCKNNPGIKDFEDFNRSINSPK